jgi:hypothetical protein
MDKQQNYYSRIKTNTDISYYTINLKNIMLSERSQTKRPDRVWL